MWSSEKGPGFRVKEPTFKYDCANSKFSGPQMGIEPKKSLPFLKSIILSLRHKETFISIFNTNILAGYTFKTILFLKYEILNR